MRKRIFTWQGQRFVSLEIEGTEGETVDLQSVELFTRAEAELKPLGLSLAHNVVRTRVFGRSRAARDTVSTVRSKAFTGTARAASSSFISPRHLSRAPTWRWI